MKTNRARWVGLGWSSGRWGWWSCSSTQRGLGREQGLGWFKSHLLQFDALAHRFEPDGWVKNPLSPSECSRMVCQHQQCTHQYACIFPCTTSFLTGSQIQVTGSWLWFCMEIASFAVQKTHQAGAKKREREQMEWRERVEIEGGGGAPRRGWSDDLMLLLVSAEHQLTWFPGCYKDRRKQSNLQLCYRRHNDTMNDNDIYWYYVKWKVFIQLRGYGESLWSL